MTEVELREELMKIRSERAGKGRFKRAQAKDKRVSGYKKERKAKAAIEAETNADWV